MTSPLQELLNSQKIWQTEGFYHVESIIKVFCKKRKPLAYFDRLLKEYPDLEDITEYLCFSDDTPDRPVVTITNAHYLIGLLPGELAAKYRQQCSELHISAFGGLDDSAFIRTASEMSDKQVDDLKEEIAIDTLTTHQTWTENALTPDGEEVPITLLSAAITYVLQAMRTICISLTQPETEEDLLNIYELVESDFLLWFSHYSQPLERIDNTDN